MTPERALVIVILAALALFTVVVVVWRWLADRLVPADAFDRPAPWIPTSPTVLRMFLDHGVLA